MSIDFERKGCYILNMNRDNQNCYDQREEENMEATVSKRRKLDTNKVTFSGKTLSTSQALKDVIAMRWSADVVDGNKKATVFPLKTKE